VTTPIAKNFTGHWINKKHRGKPTRTLSIIDRSTGRKAYSCTLPKNGAKIQPYFKVPKVGQGSYLFKAEPNSHRPVYIEKSLFNKLRSKFSDESTFENIVAKTLNKLL